jgi:hypothetical protein
MGQWGFEYKARRKIQVVIRKAENNTQRQTNITDSLLNKFSKCHCTVV